MPKLIDIWEKHSTKLRSFFVGQPRFPYGGCSFESNSVILSNSLSFLAHICVFPFFYFDVYNESTGLTDMIEQYKERTGHYPERVLVDKIYRTHENLKYCKQNKIRLSEPILGRPKKDAEIDKKQNYIDECERVEVERKFSLAKRKCGMGMIVTR